VPIFLRDHERIRHDTNDPQRLPASHAGSDVRDALERLADELVDTLRVLDDTIGNAEGA
jgi:uncharacterized membrane protein YccC